VSCERTDSITDQASVVVGNVSPASMWKPAAVYETLVVVDVVVVVEDESLSSSSSSSSGSEPLLPELPMSPGGQIGQPESHHKMPILKEIWVSIWVLGGTSGGRKKKIIKKRSIHGIPHASPVAQGGDTGLPELHDVVFEFSFLSFSSSSTVVGCGCGVIIIGTGVPVVPPVMSVLEPTVSVTAEKLHVVSSQTTMVAFSVVVVGSSMDVVPSHTLDFD
jgi:hypothetical protein